jgi:hypothetical protein
MYVVTCVLRDSESDGARDRQTDGQTERERKREGERVREKERERERERERENEGGAAGGRKRERARVCIGSVSPPPKHTLYCQDLPCMRIHVCRERERELQQSCNRARTCSERHTRED